MSEKCNLGRVLVFGGQGMVGSSIARALESTKICKEIISVDRSVVDLCNQEATFSFLKSCSPDWVVLAAAKVGGINANQKYPKDFLYNNLMIQSNAIEGCYRAGVEKLLFLGSSCIYPKFANNPITEKELLSGPLEPTNEPYAIAKIAGIKLCEAYNRQLGTDYRSVMPTNLYGPGDNYDAENSHVVPGLIQKFHKAKLSKQPYASVWGTGEPQRDLLFVDDLAAACSMIMSAQKEVFANVAGPENSHINVGSGVEVTIRDLAFAIAETVGFKGDIIFDGSKPNGTMRKRLDITRIGKFGWAPLVNLNDGLNQAYADYCATNGYR